MQINSGMRIVKRFSILFVLLVGLFFVASSNIAPQNTLANGCCEDCDPAYEECIADCPDQACINSCGSVRNRCLSRCDFCEGGGGGGFGCEATGCPYIPGYGYGYCVGGNCVY